MTENLTFISQRMEHFCLFGYLNQLGKYVSVHSIAFQTHWKENSLSSFLPFGNLPLSDPLTPWNFCDPLWGVWIFSGTTQCQENKVNAHRE